MKVQHGITGNYYITSTDLSIIEMVCDEIGKSKNSIYWSRKFQCHTVRIKNKKQKELVKFLYLPKPLPKCRCGRLFKEMNKHMNGCKYAIEFNKRLNTNK